MLSSESRSQIKILSAPRKAVQEDCMLKGDLSAKVQQVSPNQTRGAGQGQTGKLEASLAVLRQRKWAKRVCHHDKLVEETKEEIWRNVRVEKMHEERRQGTGEISR